MSLVWHFVYENYVSKVSTRFEFFLPGFASATVLTLKPVVLDAEFYSLSNGTIFRGGHRAKTANFGQNTHFSPWTKFQKRVFPARIRLCNCADAKTGCARCRILFSIRWYNFQWGSSSKIWTFDVKYYEKRGFSRLIPARIRL